MESRYYADIADALMQGAEREIDKNGAVSERVEVPGAFEIPLVAKRMADSKRYDAVVALGAVIRGGTPHFEYVAAEVSKGVAKAGLDSGVPVMFGVVTADSIEQAVERAGTKQGNKGWDAAEAAIEMANVLKSIA